MASTRISTPMRGVACPLRRLQIPNEVPPARHLKSACAPFARSVSTSPSPKASVSSITTSATGYVPVKPFEEQTVLATIHRFPSLEPLRFKTYPANHLYLPTRRDILHRAVIYEGDEKRLGTASTKTRYEVRGSSKKIRPQKGSGRARLGDKKSPMLRGGGVAFGPKPRDFSTKLQKKVYDLAWRTALSYRFRKGELIIVDNAMEIESPSTRLLDDVFSHHEGLQGKGRSLLVTLEKRPLLQLALEKMDRGKQTLTWKEVKVKNLLELSRVIIERSALQNILLKHQEDLTHKAIPSSHKSLVRTCPPEDLESTLGWQEFRALELTADRKKKSDKKKKQDEALELIANKMKEKKSSKKKKQDEALDTTEMDATRADAYESVASARYAYAESLPPGPERAEETNSALELLADAKKLRFAQKTGISFSDYADLTKDQEASEALEAASFPRIQALDYQIKVKHDLASTATETRQRSEQFGIEVRELELQKLEVLYDAALLAAQVHEQNAEARSLAGEVEDSETLLALASSERTNVEDMEFQMRKAKLAVAEQKYLVAELKKDFAGQRKLQEEIRQCTELVAEAEAWAAQNSEQEEAEEVELSAEMEASRTEPAVEGKRVEKSRE